MANLQERFSEVSEFIDIRYDDLVECQECMRKIEELNSDSIAEVISSIVELNPRSAHAGYSNREWELRYGNGRLRGAIAGLNFNSFQADIRGIIYV